MALCAVGTFHTGTLSCSGTLYCCGYNFEGQVGKEQNEYPYCILVPIPILSTIKLVSCGANFTVCVDTEGNVWSFGNNAYGQLGIGNTICYKIPQKIQNFLPVQTISCGSNHTMFLTKDENLWSCGANENGQLCLGNQEIVNTAGSSLFKKQILGETNKWISKPTKTSFSNIAQICAGNNLYFKIKNEKFMLVDIMKMENLV